MTIRIAVLFAAAAIAVSACSGGGKAHSAKPASAAATTTTLDPQAAARAEVLAAYEAYNRFYVLAIGTPDPKNPDLNTYLTGAALARMRLELQGFASTHEGIRLSDVSNDPPLVVSVDPARAVVDDCTRSIAHYFDVRTGQAEGAPPATAATSAGLEFVFVKDAGAWKLFEKNNQPSACQHA